MPPNSAQEPTGPRVSPSRRHTSIEARLGGSAPRSLAGPERHRRIGRWLVTPTVLRSGPYRFFFYSGDRSEPPHVHVERDVDQAKFWLQPVSVAANWGFSATELRRVEAIVVENASALLRELE